MLRKALYSTARFLASAIESTFTIVGICAVMFAGANYYAYRELAALAPAQSMNVFNYVNWPASPTGEKAFAESFGAAAYQERLRIYGASPSFAFHPNLHYITAPVRNAYFTMGRDGVRYEPGWTDDSVKTLFESGRDLAFFFGGSTVLGHGLDADETISAAANRMFGGADGPVAVNFGSQAYDQARQLDKLLYLLRIGYRPKHVVFLDGWNDVAGASRSNMRVADRVVWHGFRIGRGATAFTDNDPSAQPDFLALGIGSLPVMRYIEKRTASPIAVNGVRPDRDAFLDGFDFREAAYLFAAWADYGARRPSELQARAAESYVANLEFLHGLGAAFGFTVHAYLQPMGLFDPANVFVPEEARSKPGYDFMLGTYWEIQKRLAAKPELAVDLANSISGLERNRYIDVAHYSPAANEVLARRIVDDLLQSRLGLVK